MRAGARDTLLHFAAPDDTVPRPCHADPMTAASDLLARITAEPGRRSGRAVVRGTRLAVADVLGMLAAGMSAEEVLADFPELERDDIRACLAHAAALEGMTHETGDAA